jgi:hypothetical protein
MAERAGLVLVALMAVACGDDGGGATDAATTTTPATEATGGTGGTGPAATTGDEPGTSGDDTGDATTAAATTSEDPTTGGDDSSTGSVENPDGMFVAVGDGGRRVRSVDGEAWDGVVGTGLLDTDEETAAPDALRALAVGDGYLIAVGGGGNFYVGNGLVMRSVDAGMTWQEDLLANSPEVPQSKLYGVAASGQDVVAAGMRGKRIRSGDGGLTWTDVSFEDTNSRLQAVAAVGSTFVVVGWTEDSYEAPKTSAITTSTDGGQTWGPVDESFVRLDTIVAGNDIFVALGADVCLRGTDGVTWEDCGLGAAGFIGVSFAGGEFVLTSVAGLTTSIDGLKWTAPVMPGFGAPKQVARGNGRYAGIRWTDRGFAEALDEWTFASYATEPLRAVVFVSTAP